MFSHSTHLPFEMKSTYHNDVQRFITKKNLIQFCVYMAVAIIKVKYNDLLNWCNYVNYG